MYRCYNTSYPNRLHLSTGKLLGELLDAVSGQTNTLSSAELAHHVANTLRHGAVPGRQALFALLARAHVALDVPANGRVVGAKGRLDGVVQLVLADDELAGVGVQVVQASLAHGVLGGDSPLVGASPGVDVLVRRGQGVGEEVAHALGDGRLGQDVDVAAGRHGQLGAQGAALLYAVEVLGLGRELAGVQLLDALLECVFPRVGQALLVQAQVGVAAEGPGGLALLCVLGRLPQEGVRLLGVLVARLEDVTWDGQVALEVGVQRERGLRGLGDVDVVGRLGPEGCDGGR